MGTVATFFTGVRYDLRDFGGQDYDDTQLIEYLNRCVHMLDTELIRHKSDLTFNSGSKSLSSAANSCVVPSSADSIRGVFYSNNEIFPKGAKYVFDRRIYNASGTGLPENYAHVAEKLQFDKAADATYSLTVQYDKRSTVLTATTDSMPYSDRFNHFLREALLVYANKAKKDKFIPVDAQFQAMFKKAAMAEVIRRTTKRRPYILGF